MTKLLEWMFCGTIFLVAWVSIITKQVQLSILENHLHSILYLPIFLLSLFGMYAVTVVLYRVFTFNNCEEAAKELQEEILQAKEDLKKKGFIFKKAES